MNHLAIKRKHVLGDLYNSCEVSESIPVYINDNLEEPIGTADSSLGVYVDAFLFHLPEDVCKKLSTGHYQFGLDYDVSDDKNKVKLNHILLVANKPVAVGRRSEATKQKE